MKCIGLQDENLRNRYRLISEPCLGTIINIMLTRPHPLIPLLQESDGAVYLL